MFSTLCFLFRPGAWQLGEAGLYGQNGGRPLLPDICDRNQGRARLRGGLLVLLRPVLLRPGLGLLQSIRSHHTQRQGDHQGREGRNLLGVS